MSYELNQEHEIYDLMIVMPPAKCDQTIDQNHQDSLKELRSPSIGKYQIMKGCKLDRGTRPTVTAG